MTIAFRHQGGKGRIVEWLKLHFPSTGRIYLEPFAGKANVFFGVTKSFSYQEWRLNDCYTAPFLRAIKEIDLKEIDLLIKDSEVLDLWSLFYDLKQKPQTPLARIMEPYLSFSGKGYQAGFTGKDRSISLPRIRERIREAKILLQQVRITDKNYIHLNWNELNKEDFVYLDPPYFSWSGNAYNNIYHPHLLELLTKKETKFRWALSGYDDDLYQKILGKPHYRLIRDFPMSNLSLDDNTAREECLWTSHYL